MKAAFVPAVLAILLTAPLAQPSAAQQAPLSDEAVAALTGEWSGTILVSPAVSQDVRWRFERTPSGELRGFMGPADMGAPSIPMQSIVSEGGALRFTVTSQGGEFIGTISEGVAAGTWRQGQRQAVILTRSGSDAGGGAPPSGGANSAILGQWEARPAASPDGPPRTYFRFELGDAGELIGFTGDTPGTVTTPLSEVELVGTEWSFRVPADAPAVRRITAELSGDAATGGAFMGIEAALTMRKAMPRE